MRPSNNSPDKIERFLYQGMSCIRLNMCHGSQESHLQTLGNLKIAKEKYLQKLGYDPIVAVAVDIKGPVIRTGKIEDFQPNGLQLKLNDIVVLNDNPKFADEPDPTIVYIDKPISDFVKREYEILIGEDIQLRIEDIFNDSLTCKVYRGGTLRNFMPVYIPNVKQFDYPLISEKDKQDVNFAKSIDADFIFASYAKSGEHIDALRELVGSQMRILSKIQSIDSMENIAEIIAKSDGMITSFSHQFDKFTTLRIERYVQKHCHALMKPCFLSLAHSIDANITYEASICFQNGGDGYVLVQNASEDEKMTLEIMKTLHNISTNSSVPDPQPSDEALKIMEKCGVPRSVTDYKPFLENVPNDWQAAVQSCITISKLSHIGVIIVIFTSFEQMRLLNFFRLTHRACCEIVVVIERGFEKLARQTKIFDRVTCLIHKKIDRRSAQSELQMFKTALDFSIRRGFSKICDSVLLFNGHQQSISVYLIPLNYKFKK